MHIRKQIHNSTNIIKSTWDIIKDSMGSSRSYSPITKINTDNGSTTIPEEISKALNEFFVDIAKNLDNKHADINKAVELLTKTNRVEYMEMKPIPFTENELIHTISTMKTKKSSGYDGISNMIVKHCVKAISKPFTYICNFSLTNGIFADTCKYALVLPVYKRGERTNRSYYEPISLLLSLPKVLETMMLNGLNQHLNINRIIVPEQYGFRRGINMENAVFSLTNTILSSLNKKQVVAGLFCDLSKAFSSVNHSALLQKLSYYGVRRIYLNWFESYLTNRRQKVIICTHGGNYSSSWKTATSGVPQGSVLGPLLFLIYINDFPYIIHQIAKPVIYADDTSILVHAANVMELKVKIDDSIYQIYEWVLVNGLTLNLDKTNIIKFSSYKSK